MFELFVDDDSSFGNFEINVNNLESSTYTPGSSLSDDTYNWKVRAKDNLDEWGDWSASRTLTILTSGCGTITDIDSNIYCIPAVKALVERQ